MIDRARSAIRRARATTAPTLLEALVVLGALVAIQVVVFHAYYGGAASPAGDFLGLYSNEPVAWWRDGGLLDPPDWMPYVWGGYPAVASIQNSGWYLPAGIASLVGFDIHAAAVLQALHVAIAGLGVYVLGRRAGLGRIAPLLGLVAYSLSTGFFSNAPYVDIVRGHALAPWVLLCLSPLWPWRRVWAVPAAAVVFWQAAVGVYPGMLTAYAYAGAAWAIAWQIGTRAPLRRFALPAVGAGLVALLLSMPKYLPLLVLRTFKPGDVEDLSVLARSTLGTFVLPEFPGLPGIYSMNSYFVPAAVLLLAAFVSFRSPAVRAALVALAVTLVITVPQLPFRDAVEMLPGIGTSRFRLNDFRPFVLLPLVIGGMSGLARLLDARGMPLQGRQLSTRLVVVVLIPVAAVSFLVLGRFGEGTWQPTFGVLVASALVVAALGVLTGRVPGIWSTAAAALVVALAAGSGLTYVRAISDLWRVDSVVAQEALWGATSTELIAHHVDLTDSTQRVGRSARATEATRRDLIGTRYNSAYYTGIPSVGGYLNVHMSASFVEAHKALDDPATAEAAAALLEAPGIAIGWTGDLPSPDAVARCVEDHQCNGVTTTPVAYAVDTFVYEIEAEVPMTVVLNEAYYTGWSALLVDEQGRATVGEPTLGPAGMIALQVPEGSWQVTLTYRTPLEGLADALAAAGLLLAAVLTVARARALTGRRRHMAAAGS
ncbi:hypothetical protein [Actinotalea subterranea]|uniref:hypothetical protein n=1 Tax=Actinotalea subterranea TaxID=2607497 RepID=UPI0011F04723|nr:hypothetical protein [Actinotalea subterranea]